MPRRTTLPLGDRVVVEVCVVRAIGHPLFSPLS